MKMLNVLVLSVAINRHVTPGKCSEMCTAELTASASEKKMALVGCRIGSRHWYPFFSDKNQMPNPHVDASTWIVSVECTLLPDHRFEEKQSRQSLDMFDKPCQLLLNHFIDFYSSPHLSLPHCFCIYPSQTQPQPRIDI